MSNAHLRSKHLCFRSGLDPVLDPSAQPHVRRRELVTITHSSARLLTMQDDNSWPKLAKHLISAIIRFSLSSLPRVADASGILDLLRCCHATMYRRQPTSLLKRHGLTTRSNHYHARELHHRFICQFWQPQSWADVLPRVGHLLLALPGPDPDNCIENSSRPLPHRY